MLFGGIDEISTRDSYINSFICFFLLTLFSVYVLLGRKYVVFYCIAYVVLALIGLAHYLFFLDPDYFIGGGDPPFSFQGEYQSVYYDVGNVIEGRKNYGLLYFDKDVFMITHPEIWRIISWPFTFLGHKWLSYSLLNTYVSLVSSANIVIIYYLNHYNSASNMDMGRIILLTSAFFPLWWFNDQLWRDPMGVALMSIGLVFVSLSHSPIEIIVSLVIFGAFSYIQRTIYALIAFFTAVIKWLERMRKALFVILIPLLFLVFSLLLQQYGENQQEGYMSIYLNPMSFWALPIKIIIGLIGPFPWNQFLLAFDANLISSSYAFQLSDYFLGTFQLGYLFAIVFERRRFSLKNVDFVTLMGFSIMITGFVTPMMHIGYIAEGLIFTLPWFFGSIGNRYWRYMGIAFLALVLLNVFVLAFGISGISSIWR